MDNYIIPINRTSTDKKIVMSSFNEYLFRDAVQRLEKFFSQYSGLKYALYTSYCRTALYLTYRSLKLKGEVLVSPLTCSIAILPLISANLKPCFVDVDPQTYNMDYEKINESINKNTRAIQVIHLAGNPCDMKPIMEIAEDHNLLVIEDCAQALNAEHRDKKVGSFGDISCFSLSKSLYGIGGVITTNDDSFFSVVSHYSKKLPKKYNHPMKNYAKFIANSTDGLANCLRIPRYVFRGFNKSVSREQDTLRRYLYNTKFLRRPTKIEASLTLPQLRMLPDFTEKRVKNALMLNKELGKNRAIKQQIPTRCSRHVYTKYMIETPYSCINVIRNLRERGIEAMHLTTSTDEYQQRFDKDPVYSQFKSIENCDNYLKIHDHVVCLPISSNMGRENISFISYKLDDILNKLGR